MSLVSGLLEVCIDTLLQPIFCIMTVGFKNPLAVFVNMPTLAALSYLKNSSLLSLANLSVRCFLVYFLLFIRLFLLF